MLIASSDPSLYLVGVSDVYGGSLPTHAERYRAAFLSVLGWADQYLCQGHPELGRSGPVCPYARASIDRELLWLTAHPGSKPGLDALSAAVGRYGKWFRRLPPTSGRDAQFKSILILLPDLPAVRAPEVVDLVHAKLKPGFVSAGLMLGQFYPGCEQPGVWNERFRPLRSTVPMLTIRHMVSADGRFLVDDAGFLAAYLARFRDPSWLQAAADDEARGRAANSNNASAKKPFTPVSHRVRWAGHGAPRRE